MPSGYDNKSYQLATSRHCWRLDSTECISPAGAIKPDGPAGRFLAQAGVSVKEFNSFGSRRGNDRIMTRGTFANVRFKNKMADGKEGGYTKLMRKDRLLTYMMLAKFTKNAEKD